MTGVARTIMAITSADGVGEEERRERGDGIESFLSTSRQFGSVSVGGSVVVCG